MGIIAKLKALIAKDETPSELQTNIENSKLLERYKMSIDYNMEKERDNFLYGVEKHD